jgi:hypothetical protein
MTLLYNMTGFPLTTEDMSRWVMRKGANSVDMSLGEIDIDLNQNWYAPACEYSIRTRDGEEFSKTRPVFSRGGKNNNPLRWAISLLPCFMGGDGASLEYEGMDRAKQRISLQAEELRSQGLEVNLNIL